jgi:hypothetical protein
VIPSPDAVPLPPDLTETRSGQGFRVGLYLEHLEEAASLWEQRPADRENPDLSWLDLAHDEGRMEAHLDALVLGGDLALAVCRQQATAGDAGQLHAALRVFCRYGRGALVGPAMEAVDPDDAEALDAMSDALVAEMPEAWEAGTLRLERLADPRWLRLAADLVTHRALPARGALLAALPGATGPARAAAVHALGRSSDAVPEAPLVALLHDDDADVRLEAGLALLRGGMPTGLAHVLPAIRDDAALLPLLALAGHATAVPWLSAHLVRPDPSLDALLALGLLGDPAAVPALLAALDGPHPAAAAQALHLITGADLVDETFVEDVPADDELFDDEREALASGEPIVPADAPPRGTTLSALSVDPTRWRTWWGVRAPAFADAARFRLGWPAGPASQVASLASPLLPHAARGWVAEELVVRYRLPLAFETTWSVARQQAALADLRAWAEAQPFVPGRWYVGGHYVGVA